MSEVPPSIPKGERLGLGYLYGGSARMKPGEVLGPRLLGDFELVLIIEGRAVYEVGTASHQLEPGSLVLARPGFLERYEWDCERRTLHSYAHFGVDVIPRDWPDPDQWPVVRAVHASAISELFRMVIERSHLRDDHPSASPPDLDCHLVEILIELFLDPLVSDALVSYIERPEPVARTLTWMRHTLEEKPHRTVSLKVLERVAGISATHLCRIFRRSIGHPPMETFRLLQLQFGAALLVRSNLAVKEIAERCGFTDPLYFSRCFSNTFGRSPSLVRHELKRRIAPPKNLLPVDLTPRVHW